MRGHGINPPFGNSQNAKQLNPASEQNCSPWGWLGSPTIYAPSVRQPPNMTTVCAQWGEIGSEDVLEQVGGNNFQDVGEGNDGIERCRIMTIFNLRNVGAAVSRACSEFLLRETPLQAKRLYPISEQPAGYLWQDVVDFSCCTSNCLFSILINELFEADGLEGAQSDQASRHHQPLPRQGRTMSNLLSPLCPHSSHRQ
jgi:hypothetical protein